MEYLPAGNAQPALVPVAILVALPTGGAAPAEPVTTSYPFMAS